MKGGLGDIDIRKGISVEKNFKFQKEINVI